METISPDFLDALIDFCPEDGGVSASVGELQREGTVAAFNMLARNGCAYLADEVGMGKTYVALGIMSLLRYFDPHARVIVIAPRQNIQEKWRKELTNFVRNNWKIIGNRVKSLESTPVWEPVVCGNLATFAHEVLLNQDRDFFLRMTSFSLAAKNLEDRQRMRKALIEAIKWIKTRDIDIRTPESFLDTYSVALNGAIPDADLLIVDESHNLKQGFGEKVSNRNRVMGLAFGHPRGRDYQQDWYKQKAKRVLFLSATPFEDDYAAIHRQLEVFGFGNRNLSEPGSEELLNVATLSNPQEEAPIKKRIVERLVIRRTSGIMISKRKYTKNMYRREWRKGGVETFDQPITIDDAKTRLIVALMQKKVSEVLQTERFKNSFQIGMLSSFESFSQDLNTALRQNASTTEVGPQVEPPHQTAAFDDADQQFGLNHEERAGIDSNAIAQIARSFEEKFGQPLPHPKLDRVVETLSDVFQNGEKALVFVRRVATVGELARKLNLKFNAWVRRRMETFLPDLGSEIDAIFHRYEAELRQERLNHRSDPADVDGRRTIKEPTTIELREDLVLDQDVGGVKSFFEWFFRGMGPSELLSGAAFQRNRLSATSSVYSTLFEDNYVAEILNVEPHQSLSTLASVLALTIEECTFRLRELAYAYFSTRSRQKEGYPRLYVYESYQVAALTLISRSSLENSAKATIILQERFLDSSLGQPNSTPPGFPSPDAHLSMPTVFTELKPHQELRKALWPIESKGDFRTEFRRREQRRELFSAIARLGAAYIDLYLLGMKISGSFELGLREHEDQVAPQLARDFVALLAEQRHQEGFHAFRELSDASKTFDTLVAVNFADIEQQELASLARYFGTILGQQVPVGEVSGQVNKRVVAQFRMPGFPLALISTDVLQEGEDLHTFCRRVLHYGVAWTPSAIEQRTGRIDRIGGLVQRNLDGRVSEPEAEELIQVFYPHLRDTVELLQVRKVLRRLNQFIELMHLDLNPSGFDESSIDANKAVLDEERDIPQYTQPLKSAFEVKHHWLEGEKNAGDVTAPNWGTYLTHFRCLHDELRKKYRIHLRPSRSDHEIEGVYELNGTSANGMRIANSLNGSSHDFVVRLKSQVAGEETLLQCESSIGELDLSIDDNMTVLSKLALASQTTKICVEPRITRWLDRVFVRQEILFEPDITQPEDLYHLFENVVPVAAELHHALFPAIAGGA